MKLALRVRSHIALRGNEGDRARCRTVGIPDGAQVRPTTEPMWSLAWDAPSGPGHDAMIYPCSDCGRRRRRRHGLGVSRPPGGHPGCTLGRRERGLRPPQGR